MTKKPPKQPPEYAFESNNHRARRGAQEKVRARFWPTLKKAAARIPFSDELVAIVFLRDGPKNAEQGCE